MNLKKDRNSTPESIRYVSKLLRSRIKLPSPKSLNKDHDQEISKNFWYYCKAFIEIPSRLLPEFDKQKCNNYFRKSLAAVNPTKLFFIPEWIPKVNESSVEFNLAPPTYHDQEISKNFWYYCKTFIEIPSRLLPEFDKQKCNNYFRKSLAAVNPTKLFFIPEWIPKVNESSVEFNLAPPTYNKICKIVKRMKASGSKSWQRVATILIYKKGDKSDPSNVRPITLEPVMLKIFTSLLRDRVFEFLHNDNYIETSIQKGFTPGLSGTYGHIANVSHIINDARRKQHSVTITLIDLQNAFSEMHHNLIDTVLKYHHIPDGVIKIIRSLYSDFHITILTNSFSCDFIKVGKGVLQGDCFSPLIFNMVMNTFIQYIRNQYFQQFGYQFLKHFTPRHWLQFADDAAAITGQESENQTLLNAFDRWCTGSHMIIKVEKCHSFGMKKCKTKCEQIKPKLYLNNKLIKPVKIGESFVYLGRYFDFNMTNNTIKKF